MAIEKKYISERGVCEMTGRALQTLRNDRCRGVGFPYVKLNRSVRYSVEDIVSFMESKKIKTAGF